MKKGLIVGAVFSGSMICALGPVVAQQREGGLTQRLRIEQEFGAGDNIGLQVPSEGSTTIATTRLTYGLESETRIQSIGIALGGGLRFGSIAEGNTIDTGFVDPLIGVRYRRDTGGAAVSVDATYRETDISLVGPLWTFLDQDGLVRPPRDFSDLTGSGKRRSYDLGAILEIGRDAPIGFVFSAGADGVRYVDATDTSLTDYDNSTIGVSTILNFDALTKGVVDLQYSQYEADNASNETRETQSFEVGFDRSIDARSFLSARIGYTTVETTENGLVDETDGPSGKLEYGSELPNGQFGASLVVSQNRDGQRGTLRFTRAVDLPLGALSANIGLTSLDSSDPQVIGGVNWQYNLDSSQFSVSLNRDVLIDSDDEERVTTALITRYSYDINAISSISADLALTDREGNDFGNSVERGDFVVTYQRELTDDWSLNTGFDLRFRDEENVGRADASAVFFGIGRNFDF